MGEALPGTSACGAVTPVDFIVGREGRKAGADSILLAMQNDAGEEWTRLTRLYAEKSDEELLALAAEFGNLTEIAQGVLRDEMRKRRMEPTKRGGRASEGTSENREQGEREQEPTFGAWGRKNSAREGRLGGTDESDPSIPWVYLCECDSSDQLNQLAEVLRQAGIDSRVEGIPYRSVASFETCRLTVRADQLDDARTIIARPIPQDIVDELKQPVEDFRPPTCPKCGASDPLLEGVEPTNTWCCENCGARWSDAVPVENEGRNSA